MLIRFPSRKSKSTRRKPDVCSNFDLVASSPQDDHLDSVASSPREVHLDDRDSFFAHVCAELSVCYSVEAVQAIASKFKPLLQKFPIPQVKVNGCIDKKAQALMLEGFGCGLLYPVLTQRDSNCVPRALSLAVFGTENSHLEVRCRIVLELAEHVQEYVNSLDDTTSQVACETSNHYCDTYDTFIQEFLEVKSLGTFMGFWQLMAAANVFGAKVTSVYPDKGIPCHKRLFSRVLEPRVERSSSSIIIFWSSSRESPDSF